MKSTFSQLIHKPKIVVPTALVVALIIGGIGYGLVGRTPVVSIPDYADATSTASSFPDLVNLAFPKVGRLASVSVRVGDKVHAGDVLASLEANDAQGAVNQAKGALELAKAQYASLDVQYANAKKQQDVLVANAHRTLLSGGLAAVPLKKAYDTGSQTIDNSQIPTITGTYSCEKTGSYEVDPYPSGTPSGYSFNFKGLEQGIGDVTVYTPQPLGACGLFIQFPVGYAGAVNWTIDVPNIRSSSYVANKNAYDLAVATRDQVLKQYEANLGQNGSSAANTAQAAVDSAEGAYQTALGAYQNSLIIAPINGVVTFVDSHLKVGESVMANKAVISISKQ